MKPATIAEYEVFAYSIREAFPSILSSTLRIMRTGSASGRHKHIPPDIKHHRIPAPELSSTEPNLPFLIQEIEQLLES